MKVHIHSTTVKESIDSEAILRSCVYMYNSITISESHLKVGMVFQCGQPIP